jgi:hypothetical protein
VPAAFAIPPALKKSIVLAPIPRPVVAASGGTGGNAWTFVQGIRTADAYGGTLNGVTAGNLLVAFCKWENGGSITSASDGAVSMQIGTQAGISSRASAAFTYTLAATAGNRTVTYSIDGGPPVWPRSIIFEFSASGTHAFVSQNVGTDSSATISTGTFSTDTDNALVIAGYAEATNGTVSNMKCNGLAATIFPDPFEDPYTQIWYKSLTSKMTNGNVSASFSPSSDWTCAGIAFKST